MHEKHEHLAAIQAPAIGKCLSCGKEIISGYEYPNIGGDSWYSIGEHSVSREELWFCSVECLFSFFGISYKIAGVEQ